MVVIAPIAASSSARPASPRCAWANPVPASSGKTRRRHRLNRGGDRQANTALHTIALVRIRKNPYTSSMTTEALGGLFDEQEFRARHQCAGEGEHLLLAAGQVFRPPVLFSEDGEQGECVVQAAWSRLLRLLAGGRAAAPISRLSWALRLAKILLPSGENPMPDPFVRGPPADVDAP